MTPVIQESWNDFKELNRLLEYFDPADPNDPEAKTLEQHRKDIEARMVYQEKTRHVSMGVYAIIFLLFLPACSFYQHEAHAKSGAWERNTIVSLGGKQAQQGADGSSFTADNEASFQHFCQAVGIAVTGWSAVARTQAEQLSSRYAAGEISKRQATASMERIAITQSNNGLAGKLAELEVAP